MIVPGLNHLDKVGLSLSYISKSLEVQREIAAFSFGSLVADVGGVLGLFIGFNFLMVWDWFAWTVKKILMKRFKLCNCTQNHNIF